MNFHLYIKRRREDHIRDELVQKVDNIIYNKEAYEQFR